MRRPLAAALCASCLLAAPAALAEGPPPQPPGIPVPFYLPPPEMPPRASIKWNEGELIPFGYRKDKRARRGLLIAGSILFPTAWVPSAIMGAFTNPFMCIPVVGPFIVAGQPPESSGNDFGGSSGSQNAVLEFWLVFDGLQQAAGLAMFIAAFAAPETVLLRDAPVTAKPWWLPVPMPLGPRAAGLGISGRM